MTPFDFSSLIPLISENTVTPGGPDLLNPKLTVRVVLSHKALGSLVMQQEKLMYLPPTRSVFPF